MESLRAIIILPVVDKALNVLTLENQGLNVNKLSSQRPVRAKTRVLLPLNWSKYLQRFKQMLSYNPLHHHPFSIQQLYKVLWLFASANSSNT